MSDPWSDRNIENIRDELSMSELREGMMTKRCVEMVPRISWQCQACGQKYGNSSIARDCEGGHVYRGEFEVGDYLTSGQIVDIEYRRDTILQVLVERWNGERKWKSAFSAKHYDKKIDNPDEYRPRRIACSPKWPQERE